MHTVLLVNRHGDLFTPISDLMELSSLVTLKNVFPDVSNDLVLPAKAIDDHLNYQLRVFGNKR